MYLKAGAVDPFHANSIYNYAVLLDSSLKQPEVSESPTDTPVPFFVCVQLKNGKSDERDVNSVARHRTLMPVVSLLFVLPSYVYTKIFFASTGLNILRYMKA